MGPASQQQSFDELGTHLSQVTFCVVDLETTGGAEDDTITEFGAVKVRGGERLGEFQTLVNPQTAIPPLIAVLTGITNQLVAAAPTLAQVLPAFLAFAGDSVIVAHNAAFDTGFLRRACEKLGYPPPRWSVVDTVGLARQILLRDEVPNCRLATLAKHFKSPTEPNHRALTDARATVDVLHGLLERVGNLGVHTIEDLAEFTRRVSPQRRAKRTWAATSPGAPGSTCSSPSTTTSRGAAAARCCTSASPPICAPGSGPTSPPPRPDRGWTRWSGCPPVWRRSSATPRCRPR